MFDDNQDFTGVQANYLKDLCELRGNVPDRAAHNNFKIFNSYVDAYTVCPLIGLSLIHILTMPLQLNISRTKLLRH